MGDCVESLASSSTRVIL